MSDQVTLRRAGTADIATLTAVIHASFDQYRGRLVPESGAHAETEATVQAKVANGGPVLADNAEGQAIGAVLFEPHEDGSLYLGRLAVLPAARGQGLAA